VYQDIAEREFKMRIVYAGGGTGGHINPALSIADYVKEKEENAEALFIGTQRGLEKKLVPAAGYNIEFIEISGFDRKRIWRNAGVLLKLIKANKKCVKLLKEFKPDAVVCTGGYVSGPVAIAAHKLKIPALIHEQNVYPGLTVKGAEKYVDYVAVSFEETVNSMKIPEKCVVTGNPVRVEILKAKKSEARKKLGLGNKPFVLVFGGSLGAQKINDNMIEVIKKASASGEFQLLFGTGERNYDEVCEALKRENIVLNDEIKVVPYINNMAEVMAAADLVVARSGAITVSEIAALGKASILIPSPNVVRNHQEQNAREFEKNNAAVMIVEKDLTGELLYDKIKTTVTDEKLLEAMGENVKKMGKRDSLDKLYRLILKMTNR